MEKEVSIVSYGYTVCWDQWRSSPLHRNASAHTADGTQRGSGLNPADGGSSEYTDQGQLEGVETPMGGSDISFFLAKL